MHTKLSLYILVRKPGFFPQKWTIAFPLKFWNSIKLHLITYSNIHAVRLIGLFKSKTYHSWMVSFDSFARKGCFLPQKWTIDFSTKLRNSIKLHKIALTIYHAVVLMIILCTITYYLGIDCLNTFLFLSYSGFFSSEGINHFFNKVFSFNSI